MSSRAESPLRPSTVSISQAPARSSSGSPSNSECDLRAECRGADLGAFRDLGLYPTFLLSSMLVISA